MSTVEYAHIAVNSENVPTIAGTQIKVVEVVLDHLAYDSDAEELQRQHPYLSLGQIYSALAYYYDHKDEIDSDIESRKQKVERLKAEIDEFQGPSLLREKLNTTGKLS